MRKTLGVCLLALLLTTQTLAGEMPNGSPVPPPPPPPDPATAEQQLTNAATAEAGTQETYQDTMTQIALELLAVWPSLL